MSCSMLFCCTIFCISTLMLKTYRQNTDKIIGWTEISDDGNLTAPITIKRVAAERWRSLFKQQENLRSNYWLCLLSAYLTPIYPPLFTSNSLIRLYQFYSSFCPIMLDQRDLSVELPTYRFNKLTKPLTRCLNSILLLFHCSRRPCANFRLIKN